MIKAQTQELLENIPHLNRKDKQFLNLNWLYNIVSMSSNNHTQSKLKTLSMKRIFDTWWPLAASWMLMGAELPALSAVIARLEYPKINLAAYGGIVFPISLIIEAPIIMLLAASTTLCKDYDSYRKLWRFMMISGASLTVLHILIAFSPLYYIVVEDLIGAPAVIIEPARIGLMIMTPWTWSIAYRRFNQGVLIRFGHSKAVGVGTVVRLTADLVVLLIGYSIGTIPGIVLATSAVAAGVVCEAIFAGIVTRPIVNNELKKAPPLEEPLTLNAFLKFYIPLAMTSVLLLLVQPIGSAAMSRMHRAIDSLAVWPVVSGLIFLLRSLGMAYNEVVVALLDEPLSTQSLRRFAYLLAGFVTVLLLLITITPFADFWFRGAQGLNSDLAGLAITGMWISLLIPGLNVLQSWYQGAIVVSRQTRGITEAVGIFLITTVVLMSVGATWSQAIGLYIGLGAFAIAMLVQTLWLWFRARPALQTTHERDTRQSLTLASEASAD